MNPMLLITDLSLDCVQPIMTILTRISNKYSFLKSTLLLLRFSAVRSVFLSLLTIVCLPYAAAQESTDRIWNLKISEEQFLDLWKQLDSNRSSERDIAEKQILELGPDCLDHYPPSQESDSPELQLRSQRIRSQLEVVDQDKKLHPSLVSLQGTMRAEEALSQLEKITGNKIPREEGNPIFQSNIVAEFENRTFWEAFDEILDQLNLTVSGGDGEPIRLIPRSEEAPLRFETAGYSGPFRFEPIAITKSSNLQNPNAGSMSVDLLLSWEPRLHPSLVIFQAKEMELICDTGEILTPVGGHDLVFQPIGGSQLQVSLEFPLPSRKAREIDRWNGRVDVVLPGRSTAVSFDQLENATKKALPNGMMSVTLEKARKNRSVYEVLVAVGMQNPIESDHDSNGHGHADDTMENLLQSWINLQDVYIVDSNGKRIENVGWSTTRMEAKEIGLSYLFELEKGFSECKFVFRAPGSLHVQKLEIDLQDIPLP